MGKLVLECLEKKLKLKKLSDAVYKTLNQKENIKAEIVFSNSEDMQALNKSTRGVDSVTDVLSYPSLDGILGEVLDKKKCRTVMDGKYIFIGSIGLCEDKILEQAKELGHSFTEERDYLIIHGLMHLFGYDHMSDEEEKVMFSRQEEILSALSITR